MAAVLRPPRGVSRHRRRSRRATHGVAAQAAPGGVHWSRRVGGGHSAVGVGHPRRHRKHPRGPVSGTCPRPTRASDGGAALTISADRGVLGRIRGDLSWIGHHWLGEIRASWCTRSVATLAGAQGSTDGGRSTKVAPQQHEDNQHQGHSRHQILDIRPDGGDPVSARCRGTAAPRRSGARRRHRGRAGPRTSAASTAPPRLRPHRVHDPSCPRGPSHHPG